MAHRIKNVKILNGLIYLVFALFMVFAVHNKVNLHTDEVFSYGLSNCRSGGGSLAIEDGFTYYPANTPWLAYMTVDSDVRFHYGMVRLNQSFDVHPPLYYAILHTICSFFPGIYSIWFAALINIVFALGVLFFVRRLVFLFTKDEWVQKLASIAFVCSAGILSSVTFMRMYIMAMFWVIALTYVVVKQIGEKSNFIFYIVVFGLTVCGALTHYYYIVYAAFLCIAYGCYLIYQKQWKAIGLLCLTQGMSAAVSIGMFPAMLTHIFSGYRGVESFDNLVKISFWDGLSRIGQFWRIVDNELFGGLLFYVVCAGIVLCVINRYLGLYKTVLSENIITGVRYICIICPVVLYFLLVSRIAVYVEDRYMFPIYGVLFAVTLSGVSIWCRIIGRRQYKRYILALICAVFVINSWKNCEWPYLYEDSKQFLEIAAEYSDVDCVYVYDAAWKMNSSYEEVSNYHSVTFYQPNDLEQLSSSDLSTSYELIVVTMEGMEGVVDQVLEMCPYLNIYEYLGGYDCTDTYRLYIQ